MSYESEQPDDGGAVTYWVTKLSKAADALKDWRDAAETAERDYFDDRKDGKDQLFNVFYSTVNTLQARLYSKDPVPDVRRRFDGEGPEAAAAKSAAQLLERAISYTLDTTSFTPDAERIVSDFLVAGCGVPWVEYDAKVEADELGVPQIVLQTTKLKHVPWSRFLWEPGKDWADVDWVARDHYLTRAEIREQFGRDPSEGGGGGAGQRAQDKRQKGAKKYATCYRVSEIWYRPKRLIYVIGWDFDEPLEVRPDSLGLEGFYPCPRPMFANLRSNELIPKPDHAFFRRSYAYLNRLTQRIHSITRQVKSAGFYDAQLSELSGLASADDGTMIPVKNLAERLNSAGGAAVFDRVVAELPNADKVQVLTALQQLLASEKQRLDEQTGIADVVMGATQASESATAQSIKNNWANLRLSRKTGEVARAFRDVFRIMAEIMAEHFTPESLYLHSGVRPDEATLAIIKTDVGRALAIDVETDSTVALDDEAEKQQRIEFLNYVSPFLQTIIPAVQQGAFPADLAKNMVMFAVRSFKHGRALEESLEALPDAMAQMQQLQQAQQQAQQQGQQAMQQAQAYGQQAQQLGQQLQQAQAQLQQAEQARQVAELKASVKAPDPEMRQLEVAEKAIGVRKAEAELAAATGKAQTEALKGAADTQAAQGIAQVVAALQASAEQQTAVLAGLAQAVATIAAPAAAPRTVRKRVTINKGRDGKPESADVVEVTE